MIDYKTITSKQVDFVEALFTLHEKMGAVNPSLNDIKDLLRLSVADGMDMLCLNLAMLSIAAEDVRLERPDVTPPAAATSHGGDSGGGRDST